MTMADLPPLDSATLLLVAKLLEDRLQAVVTYGAGGCPSCHDAELRGAITTIKKLVEPAVEQPAPAKATAEQRSGQRRRY